MDNIAKIVKKDELQALINEAIEKKSSKSILEIFLRMEKIKWLQRSREADIKKGGWITSYFHKLANARSRRNSLAKLVIDGVLVEDKNLMTDYVVGSMSCGNLNWMG